MNWEVLIYKIFILTKVNGSFQTSQSCSFKGYNIINIDLEVIDLAWHVIMYEIKAKPLNV